jgi:hypothetical protein
MYARGKVTERGILNRGRIQHSNAGITLEIIPVERQDFLHPIDMHRGDKMRVMYLLAAYLMQFDQPLPTIGDARRPFEQMKRLRSRFSSLSTASSFMPNPPLLAPGRVATAQNSTRFCGTTQGQSLALSAW